MSVTYYGIKPTGDNGVRLNLNWMGNHNMMLLLEVLPLDGIGEWTRQYNDIERDICEIFGKGIHRALADELLVDVATEQGNRRPTTKEWVEHFNLQSFPLSEENRQWLIEIGDFFSACGGCNEGRPVEYERE